MLFRSVLAMLVHHLYTEKASQAHEAGKKIPAVMYEQPRRLCTHCHERQTCTGNSSRLQRQGKEHNPPSIKEKLQYMPFCVLYFTAAWITVPLHAILKEISREIT